jgi:hypothetical protein
MAIAIGSSPMFLEERCGETTSEVEIEPALELASPRSGRPDPAT